MTRRQILEAITPLSHLNRWARTPYELRRDMYSAKSAVYAMKNLVIRAALDEGLCSLRMVQVERPCKVCKGTGVYERIGYDGEHEYYDDCRRCNSTGRVILRFAETAIESVKWHTPRPNAEALKLDPGMWEKCETTDWEPEQPGEEIDQPRLFSLLNAAERAICGEKLIRYKFNGPFAYPLHFGTIEECFVCGHPAKNSWSYRPEIYRPGMRWNQGVCDGCASRAERWPKQWPANLLRRNTMWNQDFPKWSSMARRCLSVWVCVQQQVDGELQKVTAGRGRRDFSRIPMDRRREMFLRWVSEGIEKGWKPSGAWARYYAMFKTPPEAEWMLEADAEMRPIIAARDRKPGELIGV